MKLGSLFTKQLIFFDLRFTTKKQIISYIAEILEKDKRINNPQLFISDVYERESLGPTNMGLGVAIPHSKSEAILIPSIVFLRLEEAIKWEGNETPVKLVFLLAVPKESKGITHLEIISELAGLLMEDDFIALLNQTKDANEILTYLKNEIGGSE